LKPKPGEINGVAVDRFTAVHFASGYVLGQFLPLWLIGVGAVAFELVEDPMKTRYPQIFPHPSHDSKKNSLVDVGAVILGAWIGGAK
jgi:hypothetical protein